MPRDAHGLEMTAADDTALAAFDNVVTGYLRNRADTPKRLTALLATAPDMPMAHCLKGYLTMLGFKQALVPAARDAEAQARRLATNATSRERAHVEALSAWTAGDIDRLLSAWEAILDEHPHDVLAFRLHHFNAFWHGRAETMQSVVERLLPKWSPSLPGYGALLACRAFANEECGNYVVAEAAGRAAIEIDPGDVWAAHAIAHVLEMQGRRGEGIEWLKTLEPNWEGANNLAHHLWWHRGLYHLERGEHHEVLALYDGRFRNLSAALTQAQPDLYIDVQNAASMLYRLGRQGVDVGERWEEIADKAEQRIGDCLNPFTLPHWMMALTATRRWAKATEMIEAMKSVAMRNDGSVPPLVRRYALPLCEGILALAKGEAARAVELMRPALGGMYRLGGSHAQQDVLEQLFLEAAMQAASTDDARLLLERVTARHPVAPERRIGYRAAARAVKH